VRHGGALLGVQRVEDRIGHWVHRMKGSGVLIGRG
jgi:hypothetical protein